MEGGARSEQTLAQAGYAVAELSEELSRGKYHDQRGKIGLGERHTRIIPSCHCCAHHSTALAASGSGSALSDQRALTGRWVVSPANRVLQSFPTATSWACGAAAQDSAAVSALQLSSTLVRSNKF